MSQNVNFTLLLPSKGVISMKKIMVAVATGLLLATTPMHAQEAAAEPTMQDDLDCAMFLASIAGTMEKGGAKQEEKTGVMIGMIYFIGRYEGAGGDDLQGAMIKRFGELEDSDLEGFRLSCSARMESVGQRLISAGTAIEEVEKRRAKGEQ